MSIDRPKAPLPTAAEVQTAYREQLGPKERAALWSWLGFTATFAGVRVRGQDATRRHPAVAVTYGAGLALIVDEFALLLDLQDVYWAKQGRVSVDLGVGLVAAGGTAFSIVPIWKRLARNR